MSNSYLNFIEEFYASNKDLTLVQVAKAARAAWATLPCKDKLKYHMESIEGILDDLAMECGTCGKKKKKKGCAKKKPNKCAKKKKRNPCAKKKKPTCKPKRNPCKKKKKRRQICC
ncbi:sperm-specific protein Don juan-like [Teleopsis dalmanni]|uniref:sperm-specific protein Don juan-like n=1 Tax=Teleopsis dalmanni TaxID=139649 RepID=UPI0018CD66EB|nr:sperm-specific protein Don juan-like [Teleopsis dalmanni]